MARSKVEKYNVGVKNDKYEVFLLLLKSAHDGKNNVVIVETFADCYFLPPSFFMAILVPIMVLW